MLQRLQRDLDAAERLDVAVAYAKESALDVLDLEAWCGRDRGRGLRLLAGTDFFLTGLEALNRLGSLPGSSCRIYHRLDRRSFHPKVYVLRHGPLAVAYVGSSNLTRGGLTENVEANVRIEGPAEASQLREPAAFFESLFDGEFATSVQPEFRSRWASLRRT